MMKTTQRVMFSAALVMATYLVLWFVWIRGGQLFFTGVIMAAAVWASGLIHRMGAGAAMARPAEGIFVPAAIPALEKTQLNAWLALLLAGLGFASAWVAYRGFMTERWDLALYGVGAGAIAWRFCMPFRLPEISRPAAAAFLFLALLVGAAFRLYKAGEIPYGVAMVDEPRLMYQSRILLNGLRQSFVVSPGMLADGAIPFYFQALSMKIFGQSLGGFRMSGIIIGTVIVLVVYGVGRAKEGAWLGLAAAFFWAMSLWPVTVSRAQYLIIDTYLVVLLCIYFFVKALNKDNPVLFALAGLFWAFTLNVYTAGQVMLALLPWFAFLVWILTPSRRGVLLKGLTPLCAGFLVGMAPLFLWAMSDPDLAFHSYFGPMFAPHTAGPLGQAHGLFEVLDMVINRGLYQFPKVVRLFTTLGVKDNPWYFPPEYPAINQTMLYLFLVGGSVCLARFRNPFYAFLLYWWFAGLLPAMVADPSHLPNDRREMMSMPPMLLMASVGLLSSVDLLTRVFHGKLRVFFMGLLGLGFFAWLAPVSWHDYFIRNQRDPALLMWGEAPTAMFARAVYDEDKKSPVVVVASHLWQHQWTSGPIDNPYNSSYWTINPGLPTSYLDHDRTYFESQGLFNALRWGATGPNQGRPLKEKPDILLVLTPFHFYLEPLLHQLGGVTVKEIPRIPSSEEAPRQGNPASPDQPLCMKLIRFHNFNPAAIDALPPDSLFEYTAEELAVPKRMDILIPRVQAWRAEIKALVEDYDLHPRDWRSVRKATFRIPDPWFWTTLGNLPAGIASPFRLRSSFEITIPADGAYAFGASATPSTRLSVDGKSVFRYAADVNVDEWMQDGVLGEAVPLKAGIHRLDLEQVWLSPMGNFQHTLRVVWKKPGGEMETLPLEFIRPFYGQAKKETKSKP